MLKLGSIYPRYVGPRLVIPGGTLDGGGMLDLLHRYQLGWSSNESSSTSQLKARKKLQW